MEKPDDAAPLRIDSGEISSFMAVAAEAGERKVGEVIAAAMLPRNDMVDLETQLGETFRKLAVLASETRTPPNPRLEAGVHAVFSA
jgi:hypothetical protein